MKNGTRLLYTFTAAAAATATLCRVNCILYLYIFITNLKYTRVRACVMCVTRSTPPISAGVATVEYYRRDDGDICNNVLAHC